MRKLDVETGPKRPEGTYALDESEGDPYLSGVNRFPIKIATLCILIFYILHLALKSPISTRWVDFPVYWEAGQKALQGQTVYDVSGHFQYKYSPFIALLFGTVFQFTSFLTASWIFRTVALTGWLGWATLHIYNLGSPLSKSTSPIQINPFRVETRIFWLAPIGALLFLGALRLDLELGQMNFVCAWLMTGAFMMIQSEADRPSARIGREIAAGALLAVAVQLKLYCLVFVPYLFFRREWRVLLAAAIALVTTSFGVLLLQRGYDAALAENIAWIHSLFASTETLVPHETNVSLLGWGTRVGGPFFAKTLWLPFFAGFLALSYRGRHASPRAMEPLLFLGVLFLIPLVWSYWVTLLFPLVALHFSRHPRFRAPDAVWILLALAFQAQHSHANMRWGFFPALVLFLFAIRETLYDVFKSADCFAPSRSR